MQPHMIDVMFGCATADFYGHQTHHGSFVFGSDSGWEVVDEMVDPSTNTADPSKLITNSMTLSASGKGDSELYTCTQGRKNSKKLVRMA